MDETQVSTRENPGSSPVPAEPLAPAADGAVLNPRRVKARDVELRIDPAFRDVLPVPSAASVAALRTNLLAHGGCTNFILVWAGTDKIIDGHNRYPLCREHDLWIWLGEIELADRDAVQDWIRKLQLSRRDLGRVVASCVRGEAYNARKGRRGGDHTSERANGHNVRLLDAAKQIAEEFGVTDRTIRRDGWLAECVARIVANCGSEARQTLLSPDHKVTRNGIVRLVKMEVEAQREAVGYLTQKGKLPRMEKSKAKVVLPRKKEDMVAALIRLLGVREADQFHKLFGRAIDEATEPSSSRANRVGGGRKRSAAESS
jgi:hypothetical protein